MPYAAWSAERPTKIRGVRALGMGDAFTAVADDQNVFFYNPAGITQRTGGMVTLLEIPLTVGTDLLDAYEFIDDKGDKLKDFDQLTPTEQADLINEIDRTITKLNPHVGVGAPNINYLSGPIADRYYWGFGGFGQVEGSFRVNTGIVPSLDYDINADVVIPVTFAAKWTEVKRIPGKIGAGVNLKYIQRNQIKDERVSVLQLEDFDEPQMQKGTGLGADIGLLYQPNNRWNFALASLDFLGTSLSFDEATAEKGFTAKPSRVSGIKSRWNLGTSWTPTKIVYWPGKSLSTKNRLLLAADVKDIFNAESKVLFGDSFLPDTAWTHVHLGAEYRWWFLRFRGGTNQGYPTYGLGLDLPLLKIDYAYYSDELGLYAGSLEQANHMITVALRFGGSKTEARERVRGEKSGATAAPAAAPVAVPAPTTPTQTPVPVEAAPKQ